MKITQKEIREYKKMAKKSYHNKEWHDFMNTEKSKAIGWAINSKNSGDSISDIQSLAINYYNTQIMHKMCKR